MRSQREDINGPRVWGPGRAIHGYGLPKPNCSGASNSSPKEGDRGLTLTPE